jgi:hypothetical protein
MAKDNFLIVNLAALDLPEITEKVNRGVVEFGADNLYPQELVRALNTSPIHKAIVTQKTRAICGDKLTYNEADLKPATLKKVKSFLASPNGKEQDLADIFARCAMDNEVYGAFTLEACWAKNGSVEEINHIDAGDIRFAPMELGEVKSYWWSRDWLRYRRPENIPVSIAAFNAKRGPKDGRQLLYCAGYESGMKYYGVPIYAAALPLIELDGEMSRMYLNSVRNGMQPGMHVSMVDGVPTLEEQAVHSRKLKDKYVGAENAGKMIVTYVENPAVAPTFTPIPTNPNAAREFAMINDVLIQRILTAHSVTSPMLMGVRVPGQLGGVSELGLAWEIFSKQVIEPARKKLLKTFNKLIQLAVDDDTVILDIESNPMVATQFSEKVLSAVMTVNEIREQIGLSPMENADTDTATNNPADTETPTGETEKVL